MALTEHTRTTQHDSAPMPESDVVALRCYIPRPERGTRKARALAALYTVFPGRPLDVEFVAHPTPSPVIVLRWPAKGVGPAKLRKAQESVQFALEHTSAD